MTTTDTPANPPLRLRAGAYYRTRDGRKVGPLATYGNKFAAAVPSGDHSGERLWRDTGRHVFGLSAIDLIAEWPGEPASPVRRVTKTTTEIRPGVYGEVQVGINTVAGLYVGLGRNEGPLDVLTAEEIRAAAATLTQLADGLDQIAEERGQKQ